MKENGNETGNGNENDYNYKKGAEEIARIRFDKAQIQAVLTNKGKFLEFKGMRLTREQLMKKVAKLNLEESQLKLEITQNKFQQLRKVENGERVSITKRQFAGMKVYKRIFGLVCDDIASGNCPKTEDPKIVAAYYLNEVEKK